MDIIDSSSAVLGMVCVEIGRDVQYVDPAGEEKVPHRQHYEDVSSVALNPIGLHHHTRDTARNGCAASRVPARDTCSKHDATGCFSDTSLDKYSSLISIVDNPNHTITHTYNAHHTKPLPSIYMESGRSFAQRIPIHENDTHEHDIQSEPPDSDLPLPPLVHDNQDADLPGVDISAHRDEILRLLGDRNMLERFPNFGGPWTDSSYSPSATDTSPSEWDTSLDEEGFGRYFNSAPAKTLLAGFADFIDSCPYFWATIIAKIYWGRNKPVDRAFIINDILTRHVSILKHFANSDSNLPTGYLSEVTRVVGDLSDKFAQFDDATIKEIDLVQADAVHLSIVQESGLDFGQFSTFAGAYNTTAAIFKYLTDRKIVYPLIKLLVGGTLFAFGAQRGDPDVFTSENITSATNSVYGYFRTGTLGAFLQVFQHIGTLISSWINSDGVSSLSDHLKKTNDVHSYYYKGSKLLTMKADYANWSVEAQRNYLDDLLDFNNYCVDHLGAGYTVKNPWRAAGLIIADKGRLNWFMTTWSTLDAFYLTEMGKRMRKKPYVIFFAGGSSLGKTTLQRIVNEMILCLHLGISVENVDVYTYPWPTDDQDYANGLTNGTRTLIMDDIGAFRPEITKSTGGDPMIKALLAIINNFPMFPDQASLENKGRICLAPDLVIASTNNPKLNLNQFFNQEAAVERRIGKMIHVTVSDEFKTEQDTLDEEYLKDWMAEHPSEIPQAWNLRIEFANVNNRPYHAGGKIGIVKTFLPTQDKPPFTMNEFLAFINADFAKHNKLQESIIKSSKVPYNFGAVRPVQPEQPIEQESGTDAWSVGMWNLNATQNSIDNQLLVWAALSFLPVILVMAYLYTGLLFNLIRQRTVSTITHIARPVVSRVSAASRAYRLFSTVYDRKCRSLEWLEKNKRTLAYVAFAVGVGSIAAYTVRKRKQRPVVRQAGDEQSAFVKLSPNDDLPRYSGYGENVRSVRSTYGLSQKSLSANRDDVVAITGNNVINITFTSKSPRLAKTGSFLEYKAFALFTGNRFAITNVHNFPHLSPTRKDNADWADYSVTFHAAGFDNHSSGPRDVVINKNDIVAEYKPNRDLIGIHLPASCRPFRDITGYFPLAPTDLFTENFVYRDSVQPPGTQMSLGVKSPGGIRVEPSGIVVKNPVTALHGMTNFPPKPSRSATAPTHEFDGRIMVFQVNTHGVATSNGYCGLPWYLRGPKGSIAAIAGIHFGVSTGSKYDKFIVPVYQSDIRDLYGCGSSEDLSISEAGPIMAPALEQESGSVLEDFSTRSYVMENGNHSKTFKLHCSPFLSQESYWALDNERYMEQNQGIKVNPDSYSVLGYNSGGGKLASKFLESPYAEAISKINTSGLPGDMSCNKKVNRMSKQTRDAHIREGIGGVMSHESYNKSLADEFRNAAEAYVESLKEMDAEGKGSIFQHVHMIPTSVAINGLRMEEKTKNYRALEPMDFNTSAGSPYYRLNPSDVIEGGKRSGKHPWMRCTYDQDGRAHYYMGPELQKNHDTLLALLKADHDTKALFTAALKDEPIKPDKATRLIMVGPLDLTIICREYLLTLCRTMQLNPFSFGAVVGLDATCVQWDQIRNFVCGTPQKPFYSFDGDYRNYDKSLFEEVTEATRYVIMTICELSGNYDEDQLFVIKSILLCLLSPVVDIFGVVYWFRSFNTSGNSLTTQINCIANMLFIWVVWTRRMKKDMGAGYCEALSREMFHRFVHVVTYGDDHVIGVPFDDMLSCRIMAHELKGLIGYTDARKRFGDDISSFTEHEQLIFLGRFMVADHSPDGGGSIMCPMEWARIVKTFYFYRVQSGVQFEQQIADLYRGLMLEVHFHGREVFDLFSTRLIQVMCDHYGVEDPETIKQLFFCDTQGQLLDYDYFRKWWLDKKDYGYIKDPRYEAAILSLSERDLALRQRYLTLRSQNAGLSREVA